MRLTGEIEPGENTLISNHSSTRTCSGRIFGKPKDGTAKKYSLEIPSAILFVSNLGEICTAASCEALVPCLQASTMKDPGGDSPNTPSHQGYLSLSASLQCFPLYSKCRHPPISTFKVLVLVLAVWFDCGFGFFFFPQ